jgi:oligoribonuclease NrnB/cAMP/cGMP phosphodiesterase (DHH superfamily)
MGEALPAAVKHSKSTMVCDHHASSQDTIAKYSDVLLKECKGKFATFVNTALSESGASLAWKLTHGPEIPDFINHIRIGDTWQWDENPDVKPVLEGMYARRVYRSFPTIEDTFQNFDENYDRYLTEGLAIMRYKETVIRGMAKQCELGYVKTQDGTIYTMAYVTAGTLQSEVAVAERYYAEKKFKVPIHFCATMKYNPKDGIVAFSARSPADGVDLSVICRNIVGAKGGGHPKASGFNFFGIEHLHQVILRELPKQPVVLNVAAEVFTPPALDITPAAAPENPPAKALSGDEVKPNPKDSPVIQVRKLSPRLNSGSSSFIPVHTGDRESSPRRAIRRDSDPPAVQPSVPESPQKEEVASSEAKSD